MEFSCKISGWPTYILIDDKVKNIKPSVRSPNLTNAESWLRVLYNVPGTGNKYTFPKLDVISYSRDGTVFNVSLVNQRKVDDEYVYDATIKHNNYFLVFDPATGLTLSETPSKMLITTSCQDKISDGGQFIIGDNSYVMITKNSDFDPVLGQTDNKKMASPFIFSWTGFTALKTLITLFLKARYFIDHPKLINKSEKLNEIRQIYNDIGQIIIKDLVGDRRESTWYRDQMGHFISGTAQTIQEKFDNSYCPSVLLDDRRHMYPPFAIPPSTLVDRFSNDGVDYQRAVTTESSDAVMGDMPNVGVVDSAIVKNAQKVLWEVSIQPSAWDKIRQAVSPIGGFDDVWPCVLIINQNNIGVNLDHPVFSGSMLGTDPLFFKGLDDGYTRKRSSTGVCIMANPEEIAGDISAIPDLDTVGPSLNISGLDATLGGSENFNNPSVEHMCPIGSGGKGFNFIQFLILLILVVLVAMSIKEFRKEKNIVSVSEETK